MNVLVYNGPRDVGVTEVPEQKIERPADVLTKITSTNIWTKIVLKPAA